jgi:hypothetical protein
MLHIFVDFSTRNDKVQKRNPVFFDAGCSSQWHTVSSGEKAVQ